MRKKIFISHSSQNKWLLEGLLNLIRETNRNVSIFCSSEAVIPPGDNYKDEIYAKLEDSDMFIAIISDEYWKSKFAIMELGAAYQRYCFDTRSVSIQPLLVPPLDKGSALANTPLVQMQLTDLTDADAVALLVKKIAPADEVDVIDRMMPAISKYTADVKKTVLSSMSLTKGVDFGAYYQEPADNPIPKDKIVRCQRTEEGGFLMDFHLSRVDYIPSFASVAIQYWNKLNLKEYLKYDRDATFVFTLENTAGVLNYVNVEFKYGNDHLGYKTVRKDLVPGSNRLEIPLEPMDNDPLAEISQICFVIIPRDMNSMDGEIVIDNLDVEFQGKDLF